MDFLNQVIQGIGNIAGQWISDDEYNKALNVKNKAYSDFYDTNAPNLPQAQYNALGPTELGGISEDPRLRAAQMQALDSLGREVAYNGETPEDALAYQKAQQESGRIASGLTGAATQSAAQRGLGGGLQEYIGGLTGAQAGANQANQMQLQEAADARARKLQALDSLSGMASGIRGQDYGIASARANAQDLINKYNNGMMWNVQQYNNQLPQQNFENQLGLDQARLGAANSMENTLNGRGQRALQTSAKWGKYAGDTASSFVGGLGGG